MRFEEFFALKTKLDALDRKRFEEGEERRQEFYQKHDALRREWKIGHPQFLHCGAPVTTGTVYVCYDPSDHIRIEVDDGYRLEINQGYLRLSPNQWRVFADIVEVIERWKLGEIDELPVSGIWLKNQGKGK